MFAKSAVKELEALNTSQIDVIFPRIKTLRTNPRPRGCRKLRDRSNLWRIRTGDYRVIYAIDDKVKLIDVIAVRHRKDVYRRKF